MLLLRLQLCRAAKTALVMLLELQLLLLLLMLVVMSIANYWSIGGPHCRSRGVVLTGERTVANGVCVVARRRTEGTDEATENGAHHPPGAVLHLESQEKNR